MSGIRGGDPARDPARTRRVPPLRALLAVVPFSIAGWLGAASTLLVDLLSTPWVLWRRTRPPPPDRSPRTREASLVVLNWNGRPYLERLLPSLEEAMRAAPGNHEAIVVDNGSTDGSADFVRGRFPWARLVPLPENRFFGRGISAGIERAGRDILVLLNNDMVVERDFLRALLARFDAPDLFAVTAQIRLQDPRAPRVETGKTRAFRRRGDLEWIHSPVLEEEPSLVPAFWAGGGSSAFDREKF
ncbi:MAG TPA: glycosyltransferase, partial [Planctomycetota bacterium]|nr:glycosyltransferase [Planctomycetota bacterium]